MSKCVFRTVWLVLFLFSVEVPMSYAADGDAVTVTLKSPAAVMKMGDTPQFVGAIKNTGTSPLRGIVVYLSLVALKKGDEHPEDLEDWSAQKAVHISTLKPGEEVPNSWKMRLIKPGEFGVALTAVVSPLKRPVTSELLRFMVHAKPLLPSGRIRLVAFSEPVAVIVMITLAVTFFRRKRRSIYQK